jgi:hypothetical protein
MDGSPRLDLFHPGWVGKNKVKMVEHLPERKNAQAGVIQKNTNRLVELEGLGYIDNK